jgi:pyruvate kinase
MREVYAKSSEVPSIIFDLKGASPYITRLEGGKRQQKVRLGDTISIAFDDAKIKDSGIIFIDKKITKQVNEGDLIYISSSDVILKVTGKSKYIKNGTELNGSSCHDVNNINEYKLNVLRDNIFAFNTIKDLKRSHTQCQDQPPTTEEPNFFDTSCFDSYLDDKIINRQDSINKTYSTIIKRHRSKKIVTEEIKENKKCISNYYLTLATPNFESKYHKRILTQLPRVDKCSIKSTIINCEVVKEGTIDQDHYLIINKQQSQKTKLDPKDIIDLSKLPDLGVNIISCMVDNAEHLLDIKDLLTDEVKNDIKIFAKIETERAVVNFDSILANSDGIIIKLNSFYTKIPKEEVI